MAILFSDLADYNDITGSIKKLSDANKQFGDDAVETNARIKQAIADLIKETDHYAQSLQAVGKLSATAKTGATELITTHSNLNTQLKQNQTVIDSTNKVIQSMTDRLESLEKEYDSLGDTEKKDLQRKREIQRELISTSKALNGLATATQGSAKAVKSAEGSYNALKESTTGLLKQLKDMPDAYNKGTGKLNEQNKAAVELNKQYQQQVALLGKIEKGQGNHTRNVGNYPGLGGQIGGAIADVTGLGSLGTAAGIAGIIASAGAAVISVGQEYEKLNLLTENALKNNKAAAKEANALIVDFANHSPLEIGEVTEAFTRLVSIGIIPSEQELKQISDFAISKNKDISSFVEMLADAQQGQFDRLAEFSINAQKSGDKVVFTYNGVRTSVDNTSKAISDYLIGLGKLPGVMGATDKLAESFSGRLSTMWDGLKGIANDIFQLVLPALNAVAGGFSWAINKMSAYTTGLRALYKAGSEKYGALGGISAVVGGVFTGTAGDIGEAEQAKQAKAGTKNLDLLKKQTDQQNKLNDAARKKAEANEKAEKNADKVLHDNLSNKSAATDSKLATLNDNRQDGLISEREFIKQRQEITLAGIKEREDLLAKAHKTETAEYQKLETEKKAIATLSKRDLLKLDLADSKSDATNAVAGLGKDKEQGLISETEYNERKRGILLASVTEQRGILQKAGQQNSELAKALSKQEQDIEKDYFAERLTIAKKGWKSELDETKDELKAIDQQAAESYESELVKIQQFYDDKRDLVEKDAAMGKITPGQKNHALASIDISQLQAETQALQLVYAKDQFNSNVLTESKIKQLQDYKAVKGRTDKEIQSADEQIAALKKARDENAAKDSKKLVTEVADKTIAQSKRKTKAQIDDDAELAAKKAKIQDKIFEIASTVGDGLFAIEQQNTQNKLTELDRQKQYELDAVGSNESAKAFIEKKYAREKADLERKQAVTDKEKAIFDIAIATALNVVKSALEPFLIPYIIALGAAQAAIVLASPIPTPAYFAGKNIDGITNDNYAGPALVGDRYGRELWHHDGVTELVNKPTMINVGRSDVIYPNAMTERLLAVQGIQKSINQQSWTRSRIEQNRDQNQVRIMANAINWNNFPIKQLAKAIGEANEKLPFNMSVVDADGLHDYHVKQNQRTEYKNKRMLGNRN